MATIGEPEMPLSPSNLVPVPSVNLGEYIYVNASCGGLQTYKCPSGKGDVNGYAAVVYLYAADLTLEQTSQPSVANVGGELATVPKLSGIEDLSFEAYDPGSGVYQAVFAVDGAVVGRTLIDENGGRCRDTGQATDGLPSFLYLSPCPASASADVPFDTTSLADGQHHLVVSVTDAAGSSVVALDRRVEVVNHPLGAAPQLPGSGQTALGAGGHEPTLPTNIAQPHGDNGSPATAAAQLLARWSATARPFLTAKYGRAQAVSGRLLTAAGAPIAGAAVAATFLPAAQGAHPRALPPARTASDGSFHLRLPSPCSGRLTLAYASHLGQPAPDVTAALTLTVPAALSLRVTPRASHAGGTIRFAGALRGGPLPAGGKQLVLEARTPGGRWRQFQALPTRAGGRYASTYRFRLPGPIVYQFRALSPREADFPFAAGASNVVSVRER
jgi:hypothetical protein